MHNLSTMRLISGYRTIPDEAALVLAKTIPVDIFANKMRRIYTFAI